MKKGLILVMVVAMLALFIGGCNDNLSTTGTPAEKEANFRLLISDAENEIKNFASLNVTITDIALKKADEPEGWIYLSENECGFQPTTVPFVEDGKVTLIGNNATVIFNGYVASGNYTKVMIYTDNITGVLNGENVTVKLPSGKLQISKPFKLSDEMLVNFVFDITVIKAGKSKADGFDKYILKPQIGESGPNQNFNVVTLSGETNRNREKHKEEHGKPETPPGKPDK